MKILFVKPHCSLDGRSTLFHSFFDKLSSKLFVFQPQITFPVLAALTPINHDITMIDERTHKINFNKKYDLVGISVNTMDAMRAYEIADIFRKKGRTVILGGCHVSALPDEATQHADSIIIGEAEETWPLLLKDYQNGTLQPYYQVKNPPSPELIPIPNREILNRVFLETGVQTSRGCPYRCKYCFIGNSDHGRIYRERPVEDVVTEMEKIRQKIIVSYDASLTVDPSHTKSLLKALKKTHKNLICLGNINVLQNDDDLLKISKESGCIQWNIGFESIVQQSINEVEKNTNTVGHYLETIEKIHSYGMNVHGFFIFGFDNDDSSIFRNTLDFIKKSKMDSAEFSILTPFPGTPLYDELQKQNRILTKNWSFYNYNTVVFKPKNLTESEIKKGMELIYRDFYSYQEIIKRLKNSLQRKITVSKLFVFVVRNILMREYVLKSLKK